MAVDNNEPKRKGVFVVFQRFSAAQHAPKEREGSDAERKREREREHAGRG
jgi:hypothetical protein